MNSKNPIEVMLNKEIKGMQKFHLLKKNVMCQIFILCDLLAIGYEKNLAYTENILFKK